MAFEKGVGPGGHRELWPSYKSSELNLTTTVQYVQRKTRHSGLAGSVAACVTTLHNDMHNCRRVSFSTRVHALSL